MRALLGQCAKRDDYIAEPLGALQCGWCATATTRTSRLPAARVRSCGCFVSRDFMFLCGLKSMCEAKLMVRRAHPAVESADMLCTGVQEWVQIVPTEGLTFSSTNGRSAMGTVGSTNQTCRQGPHCGLCVCERHFEEKYVEKTFSHVIGGTVVEIPRDRAHLKDEALPTVFPDAPKYFTRKAPTKRKERNLCKQKAPPSKMKAGATSSRRAVARPAR